MFIKKDQRKVIEVLEVPSDTISLRFARRSAEFGASSKLLTDPKFASKLRNVKQCSLYDNKLQKLEHWGVLGDNAAELEDLNVRSVYLFRMITACDVTDCTRIPEAMHFLSYPFPVTLFSLLFPSAWAQFA